MGGVVGLILLDETVVGVALPAIRRDLALSSLAAHWVINAYLLVFAMLAAAAGKLGDIFGQKGLFLAGSGLFGLASLACGLAENGPWLIAARAFQGVGAAVIFPASLAMVSLVFPAAERGRALGIYGAVGTAFLAVGPLVGGAITDLASWRWIFWINPVLVVVIALVVIAKWSDVPRDKAVSPFDRAGLASLVIGLALFVFAVMQAPDWGWTRPAVLGLLAAGAGGLALFARVEARAPAPLIELGLFRSAGFTACNLVVFAAQFAKIAIIVFGALYLQDRLGLSPIMAGLCLVAAVGPVVFTAGLSGRLADRFGARRPILAGLALMSLAVLWLGLFIARDSFFVAVARTPRHRDRQPLSLHAAATAHHERGGVPRRRARPAASS